jgi:hypothetical protein
MGFPSLFPPHLDIPLPASEVLSLIKGLLHDQLQPPCSAYHPVISLINLPKPALGLLFGVLAFLYQPPMLVYHVPKSSDLVLTWSSADNGLLLDLTNFSLIHIVLASFIYSVSSGVH